MSQHWRSCSKKRAPTNVITLLLEYPCWLRMPMRAPGLETAPPLVLVGNNRIVMTSHRSCRGKMRFQEMATISLMHISVLYSAHVNNDIFMPDTETPDSSYFIRKPGVWRTLGFSIDCWFFIIQRVSESGQARMWATSMELDAWEEDFSTKVSRVEEGMQIYSLRSANNDR